VDPDISAAASVDQGPVAAASADLDSATTDAGCYGTLPVMTMLPIAIVS
jgi:hypothetical protein